MSAWCRSCGNRIEWARTPAGRLMPVDADSAGDIAGTLAVHRDVATGELRSRVLKDGDQMVPGEHRGTSHWSTCPRAREHRRS